jgi:fucose 4-O-acetylase-like acetyltransferase
MTKIRLEYIDSLRGFLIICMVAGHIIQWFLPDYEHNHLFNSIYSFHMPLFMFVSGFVCFRPDIQIHFKAGLKRRFLQLMLPFFMWTFVVRPLIDWNFDVTKMLNKLIYPDTGFWFLWVLFFIYVIFLSLSKIADKLRFNKTFVLAAVALVLYVTYLFSNFRYFGFQFISWYFMFFIIGFLHNQYNSLINKYSKYLFVVSMIIFPILAYHWQMKIPPTVFGFTIKSNLFLYVYKLVSVIFSIPFFMYLFRLFDEKYHILGKVGKNTLGIYVIHGIISNYIVSPVYEAFCTSINFYIFLILTVIFLVTVSYFIIWLIKKSWILNILLLGNKKNEQSRPL